MAVRGLLFLVIVANILVLVLSTADDRSENEGALERTSKGHGSGLYLPPRTRTRHSKPKSRRCRRRSKCGKGEEFSSCVQSIGRAQYCSEKNQKIESTDTDTPCRKGCVCKVDYLRAENGTCIRKDQCEVKCGDNEVFNTCPGACKSDKCPKKENENADCVGAAVCLEPACTCAFNHRRADNGTCIPTRSCAPFDCSARPNEEFNPCPPLCPTDDCRQASPTGKCPLPGRIGVVLTCNPKCRCIKGYWRNNGTCVPYGQCPGVCPANERYSECIQGECIALTCGQKDKSIPCPRIRTEDCLKGCICEEIFLRAPNGICVPKDQCESGVKCGDNEILDTCPGPCDSDKCPKKENENADCVGAAVCLEPACKCAFNHKRADNGTCIPTKSCPPFDCSARPNEEFDPCPPFCPTDDCSQASPSGKCPLPGRIGIVLTCNPKCRCIKGYWRNNGTCVPYGQCPGVCPANERYSECIQGECIALTCDQKDKSIPCPRIRTEDCLKGCICEENFLRAPNGICVPKEQCESGVKCGDNEILDTCPGPCDSDKCPKKENENADCVGAAVCLEPACKCAFNHKRADNGTCILTKSCPPFDCSTRPNEEFDPCPPLCPTDDCSQASPSGECPPLFGNIGIVLTCNPACRCIKGYWRNNGTCVPYGQCPGVCPANERYSGCIQSECIALTCDQKDKSIPCPRIRPEFCLTGCVCEENNLRAPNGTCVPKDQCEINACPINEEHVRCIQGVCRAMDCSQKGQDVPCPDIPNEICDSGCICKEKFLRSENGTCLPEDQCPSNVCPANEEWSKCKQAICRAEDCTQRGIPIPCPGIAEGSCIQGCVCKDNYLRDDSGDCIPADQCYAGVCPVNEEYIACTQAVRRPTDCSERGHAVYYPETGEPCDGGCVCKENFLRTAEGNCVAEDKCGNITCFENEVLDPCSQDCSSDYCPFSSDSEEYCYKPEPCKPQCKCRFNYRRSIDGTCIETRDCPPFDCSDRPNEEHNPCPPYCPSDECSLARLNGRCPYRIGVVLECNPKCQCKEGYGRVNGTCVPYEECPGLCPTNEEYSSCVQATCRAQNCTDRDVLLPCAGFDADSCKRGCICKENFYRNAIGKCVSYEQCAGPICPDENEEYTSTEKRCPPNTCVTLVAKFKCAENQIEEPGCVCQSGYLRLNKTSPCIPICDCPQMENSYDCLFEGLS